MGEAFLSASLQVILDKLASPVLRDFNFRWSIGKKLRKLAVMLSKIQAVLNDAEQKEISDTAVKMWLSDLKDVAYDIEDVVDEFAYEVERSKAKVWNLTPYFHTNVISFKIRIANKVRDLMEKLEDITKERDMLGLREGVGERQIKMRERQQMSSVIDENQVFGRVNDKKMIIELLLSTKSCGNEISVNVVPVIGMGGLGKTTLAQLVYNDDKVAKHFGMRAWVCVSEEFDVKRLTQAILESATKTPYTSNELEPIQVSLKELLREKKFLIVLDDVWNENPDDWDLLRAPLVVGAPGSKILVTTRSQKVSSIMGTTTAYHLKGLSDQDCWSLFEQRAFAEGNSKAYPNLEIIGKKIVEKCKGLPLAAKTLGGLLHCKIDEDEWDYILKSEMWDLPGGSNGILPALRLSYHHLPSHLKQCFAYLSVFPKDYRWGKEELVRLWMAEGFLQPRKGKCLEDIGSEYFDDLFWRSFFQYYDSHQKTSFVMHDLVHDLAQSISREICCVLEKDLSNLSERTRHLSLIFRCNSKEVASLKAFQKTKTLRTILLLSKFDWQPSHDFFQKLRYLRVLDLSWTTMDEIPGSVSNLKHLRYLDLSHSKIKMLPRSSGRLLNLQTLILKYCKRLDKLPSSIGNLKQLQYLHLCSTAVQMLPESIGSLFSLQTLILGWCERLSELPNSIGNLKQLRYLDLSSLAIQVLPESMGNLFSLQTLILTNCISLHQLPKDVRKLISLRHLNIDGCYSLDSIPLGIEKSTSLQTLPRFFVNREKGAKLGELKDLNNLRGSLHISGLENVINTDEAKDADLKNKQYLEKLTLEWDDVDGNMRQPSIEELILESLQPHINLEALHIRGNYCGTRFPSWMGDPSFTRLESVTLEGGGECCRVLPYLRRLPYLHDLRISKVRGLKHIDHEFCRDSEMVQGFPLLKTLKLEHLPDLEEWFGVEEGGEFPEFPCLCQLQIRDCPKLRKLPGFLFPSLLTLKLEHLCDLEEWFVVEEDGKFPCIHQLQIRYCPKLKKLPDCFSALERLEIHWCGGLVVPPRLPALHHLAVISCDDSTLRLLPYLKSLSSLCISGYDKPTSFPEGFLGPLLTPAHATSSSLETSRGFLPTTLQHLVISHCSNLESLSLQNFESLEILEVQGCSKFASFSHDWLPTKLKDLTIIESPIKYLPKGLQNLTSLNYLKMEFCNELESLPEDGLPTSLNHLCLAECKLLSKRCSEEGEDWPKIAHIPQRWIRL